MNNDELERKIINLEQAMSTMNELLLDLKEQQVQFKNVENTKHNQMENHSMNRLLIDPKKEETLPQQEIQKQIEKSEPILKPQTKDFDLLKLCQTWLPRIFVGIMLLGVVWLFKAGVDQGILTPPLRLVFGVLLSGAFFWIGERQIKGKRHALGLVLLGGSVASIVLTTFAAHYIFMYLPATLAFIINIIWIITGIIIANRHKSEYLAIFVSVGGFFVPFLINSTEPNVYVFLGYETLLTLSLLFYAEKKSHRVLYITSYCVAQFVLFIFFGFVQMEGLNKEISLIYTLLQFVMYIQLMRNRTFIFNPRLGILAFNGVLLTMSLLNLNEGSTITLSISGLIYLILSYFELKREKKSLLSSIVFGLGMFTLAIVISNEFSGEIETILFLVQGTMGLYFGYILKNKYKAIISGIIYSIGIVFTLLTPLYNVWSTEIITHVLLIATFVFILFKAGTFIFGKTKVGYMTLFYSFMLILFVVLTKSGGAVSNDGDVNRLAISFFWMLYASVAIWYGRAIKTLSIFKNNEIIYIGLIVLFITVGKLFLIDLVVVSMTIRAILFLIIGVIGVGISRMFFIKK